ncbi:MAG TPA: hypothetical protein PK513_06405 [Alphaproteobacteria bacterium]|nr:hypothetical protein [Alphaproteobacteria bacterium]USO04709.1 MAG: hypothetical protein H6859_05940 [Rhodospirillales bacterium]HOO82114.1 hypothetical protein [Alphaproteobacteria bacterium]
MAIPTGFVAAVLFIPLYFSSYLFYTLGISIWFWMVACTFIVGLYEMLRQEFKKENEQK